MRKLVVANLALGLLAFAAPLPAEAAPAYQGGCRFVSSTDPTGEIANPDTFTGVIYAAVAGYDDSGTGNPASVSVTCILYVNGSQADDAGPFAGIGIAVGAEDTSFVSVIGDTVQLCWRVTVNGNDLGETCAQAITIEVPPQEFYDIVDPQFDPIEDILRPIWCEFAPADLPVISFDDEDPNDGDLYIDGHRWIDCDPIGD